MGVKYGRGRNMLGASQFAVGSVLSLTRMSFRNAVPLPSEAFFTRQRTFERNSFVAEN